MRMPSRGVVSWMIFLAMALLLVVMLTQGMKPVEKINISEFEMLVDNQQIKSLVIKGDIIRHRAERFQ